MYVREYRVLGAKNLPQIQVEEAVYPYLGPGRTFTDVDHARAALEKAYQDAGFKSAQVIVPEQTGKGGIVFLQALEGKVGSLRVKGARYFLSSDVRKKAQSLAEGKVINFNNVTKDIVSLNQIPDRGVQPKLNPGAEPGVYDLELEVKDKLPLHGSVELNNRASKDTTDLRLNTSLSYANLWQKGHTIGASYQTSPLDTSEVEVYSGYYIWRFDDIDWLSLMLNGTKQNSNVSTLGASPTAGRGDILGISAIMTLPPAEGFFHSLNVSLDYKHMTSNALGLYVEAQAPIDYYPFGLTWNGTWVAPRSTTELSGGVVMQFRGMGSDPSTLQFNRFGASGKFFYFRGDLSHERKFLNDWELFARVHGQAADGPLVNSEQFGGGGVGTARGYLEAEELGDNALFGTVEVRTPSIFRTVKPDGDEKNPDDLTGNEWRFFAFCDAGTLTIHDPLPEQNSSFQLASIGIGSEVTLRKHLHGTVELALPLTSLSTTKSGEPHIGFRVSADF